MGIKISKVRDSKTLAEITTTDCENSHIGEYICPIENCHAQMSFVASHERKLHEKTITINAYFKLKKNQQHNSELCPYNTLGVVNIIARDSNCNLLTALDDNKYEFSLQILHHPKTKTIVESNGTQTDVLPKDKNTKTTQYTTKGTASNYINALTQILKLRAMLEESDELASVITLTYSKNNKKNKIKWEDFYCEENDYLKASSIISQAKTSYPICFHGTIADLIPQKTDKFPYSKVKLHKPYIEPINEINDSPSVELILADKLALLENFSIGQEILVYGKANINTQLWSPEDNNKIKYNYINMSIWINHKDQIIIL